MQRRSAVAVVEAGLTGAAVLALAVLAAAAIPAAPARAGSSGLVVKVTPTRGLVDRQTVTLTGRGLTTGGGNARTWFVAECTVAVRGRMNPATDTPHCDLTDAQPLHVTQGGTFSTRYRVRAGIIGDGYCGTARTRDLRPRGGDRGGPRNSRAHHVQDRTACCHDTHDTHHDPVDHDDGQLTLPGAAQAACSHSRWL